MSVQRRLREDLVEALTKRDKVEVSTIRTLIAALENAEAIEDDTKVDVDVVFRPDRPRRELTPEDVRRILQAERSEVALAAEHYRDLGVDEEADELEQRTRIVDRYLD